MMGNGNVTKKKEKQSRKWRVGKSEVLFRWELAMLCVCVCVW
jgi:hypothetical protein